MFNSGFSKTAFMKTLMNSAKKVVSSPEGKSKILKGMGTGALAGAATGAMSRDEYGQRQGLAGALKGGLIGAGVGGATGLASGVAARRSTASNYKANVAQGKDMYKGFRGVAKAQSQGNPEARKAIMGDLKSNIERQMKKAKE